MQELAAIIECTEAEMLPEAMRAQVRSSEGKAALQAEIEAIKLRI